MYSKRHRKPRWHLLDLILLLAIGCLVLGHGLHLTPMSHKLTLFLIVVVIYGLIGWWIRANSAALEDLEVEKYRAQSRDPSVYGTQAFPTRTQARFREIMSFYRHQSPDK